jgi:hypothetical protein
VRLTAIIEILAAGILLLLCTGVIRAAVTIPKGPCPNPWHPYVDDCRRWPC